MSALEAKIMIVEELIGWTLIMRINTHQNAWLDSYDATESSEFELAAEACMEAKQKLCDNMKSLTEDEITQIVQHILTKYNKPPKYRKR